MIETLREVADHRINQAVSSAPKYITKPTPDPIWVTEPFRIFFPLGILASVLGVMIWPLFYAGAWQFPPHLQHPRIMIFGFGLAFVIGFLGTAWPRFLEGDAIKRHELFTLAAVWGSAQLAYSMYQLTVGDWLVSLTLLIFLIVLGIRARGATSFPPPGFALAFSSLGLGFLVSLSWAIFPSTMSAEVFLLTKLVGYQGMLLFPLLGVGSYLFARFFAGSEEKPISAKPRHRMIGVWGTACLILVSFFIEAYGHVRLGNGVRFLAMILWAGMAAPAVWRAKVHSTRAWALRIGMGMIAMSFLVRAIWPGPGYAFQHLLFLGGFGLAILLVADRVSIGHGGDPSMFHSKSKLWRWIVWLILLTASTRVSADFKASLMISHQIYAAIMWSAVAILWAYFHLRHWKSES